MFFYIELLQQFIVVERPDIPDEKEDHYANDTESSAADKSPPCTLPVMVTAGSEEGDKTSFAQCSKK